MTPSEALKWLEIIASAERLEASGFRLVTLLKAVKKEPKP